MPDTGLTGALDTALSTVVGAAPDSVGAVAVAVRGDEAAVCGRGVSADLLFEIGSITKTFTATLLADMTLRGEVDLDDPADRYLPDGVTLPSSGDRRITLLDLATHASGLPRLPPNIVPADVSNPYADYSDEQLHEAAAGTPLATPVGETVAYSNYGFGLLGHLLGRAAARPLGALIADRVCAPLGMRETFAGAAAEPSRRAQGHDSEGAAVPHWDNPTLGGAGYIDSTIADMTIYLRANLQPESTPLREAIELAQAARRDAGPRMRVGLAWHHISLDPGGPVVTWHNGGTGGFRSFLGFHRASGCGAVTLCNGRLDPDRPTLMLVAGLISA